MDTSFNLMINIYIFRCADPETWIIIIIVLLTIQLKIILPIACTTKK